LHDNNLTLATALSTSRKEKDRPCYVDSPT
jgi:hypothetical protein